MKRPMLSVKIRVIPAVVVQSGDRTTENPKRVVQDIQDRQDKTTLNLNAGHTGQDKDRSLRTSRGGHTGQNS